MARRITARRSVDVLYTTKVTLFADSGSYVDGKWNENIAPYQTIKANKQRANSSDRIYLEEGGARIDSAYDIHFKSKPSAVPDSVEINGVAGRFNVKYHDFNNDRDFWHLIVELDVS